MRYFLILLLFAAQLSAETADSFVCQQDYAAGSLSKQLSDKYTKIETVQGDFLQNSRLESFEIEEESRGSFWVTNDGSFKWQYTEPNQQYYMLKSKKFYHYVPEHSQVNVSDASQSELAALPVKILLGIGELDDDFIVKKQCYNPDGQFVLSMLPKEAVDIPVLELNILIDKSSGQLLALQWLDSQENRTILSFKELNFNVNFDLDVFNDTFSDEIFINQMD